MENFVPVLDVDTLQRKANEFAQEGAIKTLKDFYTGYNSPYVKALEENLKQRGFDHAFTLPDVIAKINEELSKEIDAIANTAVAKTFVPLVTRLLTRANKEMKFSEILKEYIECSNFKYEDHDVYDYSVEIEKEDGSFKRIKITSPDKEYELGFYNESRFKEGEKSVYTIYSLPWRNENRNQKMKLQIENATLEIPFTPGVLNDKFVSFIATLVMAETRITFDVEDFDEDYFPERDHCHC